MSISSDILAEQVKAHAREWGASLVGIASVDRFVGAPKGHAPHDLLKNAKSVIVVAVRLLGTLNRWNSIILETESVPTDLIRPVQRHVWIRMGYYAVNGLLEQISLKTALFLSEKGYESLPLPSTYAYDHSLASRIPGQFAPFSHRHAAVAAGLGSFGKSNLLVTPQYGPRVRLDSIITAAELTPDPVIDEPVCRPECKACISGWRSQCFGDMIEFTVAGTHQTMARYLGCNANCGGLGCMKVCPVGDRL